MARDFRSRNNRSKQVKTHNEKYQYKDGKAINNVKHSGAYDTPGNEYVMHHRWMTKASEPLKVGGRTYDYVNHGPLDIELESGWKRFDAGTLYGKRTGDSKVDYLGGYKVAEGKTKTGTRSYSTTSWSPKDGRGKDKDSQADKASKANRKKQGRSGLRIALKADPSQGRLKKKSAPTKKKAGAQGGGKSGLNIPR